MIITETYLLRSRAMMGWKLISYSLGEKSPEMQLVSFESTPTDFRFDQGRGHPRGGGNGGSPVHFARAIRYNHVR